MCRAVHAVKIPYKPEMVENILSHIFGLRCCENDLFSALFQGYKKVGNIVVNGAFKNTLRTIILSVRLNKFLGFVVIRAVILAERIM